MELLNKYVRLDFKDDFKDVSEKFWRVKNRLTVGMLEAATPANISICLCTINSLTELIVGGGRGEEGRLTPRAKRSRPSMLDRWGLLRVERGSTNSQ